jgi:FkbM family methyltransferase
VFVSYAQNFEDVFLHRAFKAKGAGFYVDVGAYHPTIGSVTKNLYDRGWSGINIEPGEIFGVLGQDRPRDINLNVALLDYRGEATFVANTADPGSSLVAVDSGATGGSTVPCRTLTDVVEEFAAGREIDFIKIDVEGREQEIVASTNWCKIRPALLIVEAVRPWTNDLDNASWEPLLLAADYVRLYFDGINCFYAPKERLSEFAPHFAIPINILDDVVQHYLLKQINDEPPARPVSAPVVSSAPAQPRGASSSLKRAIRTVAGPVIRRSRQILLAPALDRLDRLAEHVGSAARTNERLEVEIVRLQGEIVRLQGEIVRAVHSAILTATAMSAVRRAEMPEYDHSATRTTLELPGGGEVSIVFDPSDESVGGVIRANGGQWEPHIQQLLRRLVTEDTCALDIGANIGAHSLAIGSIASKGRVFAFEAHPRNFGYLEQNLAGHDGFARLRPIHVALWSEAATLTIAGAKELAGSSFLVAENNGQGADVRIREANPNALAGRELNLASFTVEAVTLDAWLMQNPQDRVDLIKLDVEGAESHVLLGARELIARHRPKLIVEYNPSCAMSYFGEAPDRLYRQLAEMFTTVELIDESGGLVPIARWEDLEEKISRSKGWEDLLCS